MNPVVILIAPGEEKRLAAIEAGLAPRLDYRLVAELCGGRVQEMHPTPSQLIGSKVGRVLRSQGANLAAAFRLLRSLPDDAVVLATGETWGLPVGLAANLLRRPRPIIVTQLHTVWSPDWQHLLRWLRPLLRVDGWICHTPYQTRLLGQILNHQTAPVRSLITHIPPGVDTAFFEPGADPLRAQPAPPAAPYILAVGADSRNYPLLFQASATLNAPVVVQAASAWMSEQRLRDHGIPANVTVRTKGIDHAALRTLYSGAGAVAMPVYDTPQAAGVTAIHEAMAMGKVVVATRSRGLPEALVDGVTGRIVEPEPAAFAAALAETLAPGSGRDEMAARAYAAVRSTYTLERHAGQIIDFIGRVVAQRHP